MSESVDILLTPLQRVINRRVHSDSYQYVTDLISTVRDHTSVTIEYGTNANGKTTFKTRLTIGNPQHANEVSALLRNQNTNTELQALRVVFQRYASMLSGLLPTNEDEMLTTDIHSILATLVLIAYIRTVIADVLTLPE